MTGLEVAVDEYRVETPDRWRLELKRYRSGQGGDGAARGRVPVVLCHGFSCNGHYWDLLEKVSLARYLAGRGYDVWVPSLRGSGRGTKPGISVLREMFQLKWPGWGRLREVFGRKRPERLDWNFDDHVLQDLPTIIDTVKLESGHDRVAWVGHSMGGMAMYGYLERTGRDDVAAFVTLSSPIQVPQPPNAEYQATLRCRWGLLWGRALFNSQFLAGVGVLAGRVPMDYVRCNRSNMEDDVMRAFYRRVIEDVPRGLLMHLLDGVGHGHMRSTDGTFDYTGELGRVRVPILCMVGALDKMCDPAGVRYAYEHVGSTDRTHVELAKSEGFSADYGHIDMVLGRNARQEVFPLVEAWLNERTRTVS